MPDDQGKGKSRSARLNLSPLTLLLIVAASIFITAGIMEWRSAIAAGAPPMRQSYWIELNSGRVQTRTFASTFQVSQHEWLGGLGAAYLRHFGKYPLREEWVEAYAYETHIAHQHGRSETGDYLPDIEAPVDSLLTTIENGRLTGQAQAEALKGALEVYRRSGSFVVLENYGREISGLVPGPAGKIEADQLPVPREFVADFFKH